MDAPTRSPFVCHVFVCTNDRQGARESCADGSSAELRAALKQGAEDRGLKPRVRVSGSGCLGLCARGPNVMLYPQGIWYAQVKPEDADAILDRIQALVEAGSVAKAD